MTSEDITKQIIREALIAQDGEKFLNLSDKDQENIIIAVLIGHVHHAKQTAI